MTTPAVADRQGQVTFGISLYTGQQVPAGTAPRYRDAPELALASEEAGFDVFWVSEHHGFADGYLPAPLVLLAAIAQRTTNIQLGTGVVLGPLFQPVRLAEEACVVDHLSQGRLILGLGAGYHLPEFGMFGVEPSARGTRLAELIELLRLCWRGERFSFHGEAFSFEDIRVTPTPVREHGIPIWLGGYAPAALRRAAGLADGHLVGRGDPEIVQASSELVRNALERHPRPFTFGLNVTVLLTDAGGNADSAAQGFEYQQKTYEQAQVGTDVYAGRVDTDGTSDGLSLGSIDRYVQVRGSAAEIVDTLLGHLRGLAAWSQVHVALRALFPERDTDRQLERIERLGADVLAPIRRRLAAERNDSMSQAR